MGLSALPGLDDFLSQVMKIFSFISSDIFSAPSCLFSFWEPCNVNINVLDIVSEFS